MTRRPKKPIRSTTVDLRSLSWMIALSTVIIPVGTGIFEEPLVRADPSRLEAVIVCFVESGEITQIKD